MSGALSGYYRHPEIPKINRWLVLLGDENGFEVDVTEHWKDLQPEALAPYDVLLLNNANALDLVLPEEQRKAVEAWFATGKKASWDSTPRWSTRRNGRG